MYQPTVGINDQWILMHLSRFVYFDGVEIFEIKNPRYLPSSLHRLIIEWNTSELKSTRKSKICKSGNWTRRFLCIGVKWSFASACTLYWSKVDLDLLSHLFFSGHHNAWSDQSMAISESTRNIIIIKLYTMYLLQS